LKRNTQDFIKIIQNKSKGGVSKDEQNRIKGCREEWEKNHC